MVLHRPVELAVVIGHLRYWDNRCPVKRTGAETVTRFGTTAQLPKTGRLGKQQYRPRGRQARRGLVAPPAESFHRVSTAEGMKLIARSASAVMVRLGLTPRLAATTDPSQMYIFL